jgi:hypothetical protein
MMGASTAAVTEIKCVIVPIFARSQECEDRKHWHEALVASLLADAINCAAGYDRGDWAFLEDVVLQRRRESKLKRDRERVAAIRAAARASMSTHRKCPWCGAEFEAEVGRDGPPRIYCSAVCSLRMRRSDR